MTGTAGQHLATSPTPADLPPALPLAGSTDRPLRAAALVLFPVGYFEILYIGIPSHKFLAPLLPASPLGGGRGSLGAGSSEWVVVGSPGACSSAGVVAMIGDRRREGGPGSGDR